MILAIILVISGQMASRIKSTLDTGHKDPNSGQSSSNLAMWSP